ncbi:MAG: SDR family NAD(P)-dependent oxidoreductase [Puniceicoccaceae bacterium]
MVLGGRTSAWSSSGPEGPPGAEGSPGTFSARFPSAFVTGGSSGLGRVLAGALRAEGVEVWVCGRDRRKIGALGEGVRPVSLDLARRAEVDAFLADPPWAETPVLLVNNAGFGQFGGIGTIPDADLVAQATAMFESALRLCRRFLEPRREGPAPAVVNVSSLAVEFPLPLLHGYNAVKGGLSGFSRSLAVEFPGGPGQPFVIDLRPGDFRTGFNDAVLRTSAADAGARAVWEALEHHLRNGADPAAIWPPVRRALVRGRSRTLRVGTFFQARVAPFLGRCFPENVVAWAHRRYYRVGGRDSAPGGAAR